jgi:hypothetical protein
LQHKGGECKGASPSPVRIIQIGKIG